MSYETNDHLTEQQKKLMGSFYTPQEIASEMAELLNNRVPNEYDPNYHVLDPCCGKGNLFVAVLEMYPQVHNDNLYGIDIDKEAIQFCINKFPGGHFQYGDILEDDFTDDKFWEKEPLEKFMKIATFFSTFEQDKK
jgi:type I restriction-modification system DNA methylase subunit